MHRAAGAVSATAVKVVRARSFGTEAKVTAGTDAADVRRAATEVEVPAKAVVAARGFGTEAKVAAETDVGVCGVGFNPTSGTANRKCGTAPSSES